MKPHPRSAGVAGIAMPARRKAIAAAAGTLLLGGLSAMSMGGISLSRTIRPPAGPIPRDYFGMHIHRADTSTPWPSARFGSWRLWDAAVSWSRLEPSRGQWDFKRLDKYVAMAGLTGVNLLLPLGLSPAWASARPAERSAYQPGNAAEPLRIEDWRNYVRTVAERYKGRIRYYELWNEPNLQNFFSGSVEAMLELAREAYAVLKQVDPLNQLVAPATTEGGKHLAWLDRYLTLGGGQYMDVLSHHFYVPRQSPESMLSLMDDVRSIMDEHGLAHKPLWNTETGWWFDKPTATPTFTSWKKLKPDEAASYVSRALILGWAIGMRRFYWYSWEHGNMGLVEVGDYTLNTGGKAYLRTQEWLEGAAMTNCTVRQGMWGCDLKRGGVEAMLVWTEEGTQREWTIPKSSAFTHVQSLDGELHVLPDRSVMIGPSPILLSNGGTWSERQPASSVSLAPA